MQLDNVINPRSALLGTAAIILSFTPTFAIAADGPSIEEESGAVAEVLITGTLSAEDILGALRPVTATEIVPQTIEALQIRFVGDVLRQVPGVEVNYSAGGVGQVRIRAGEANHTLVLIDGIEASEPFLGEFDFLTLLADDVARIEVLRGQQSALYGSDAIGGVIHYITPLGSEAPGLRLRTEGGSFGTYSGAGRFAGYNGMMDYVVSGTYFHTDGFPVARGGTRDHGSRNFSLGGKFVLTPAEHITLTAVGRYGRLDYDQASQDFDFPPGPDYGLVIDSGDTTEADSFHGRIEGELRLLDGDWTHRLGVQTVMGDRINLSSGATTFHTEGSRRKWSYVSTYLFETGPAAHAMTFAADDERETYRNVPVGGAAPALLNEERVLDTMGIVGEYNLKLDDFFGFTAAYRYDWNSGFEDVGTYRFGGSYAHPSGLRLHAAYGTGFKSPTNFELFGFDPGTFAGNPNLKPEESKGWETGLEYRFGDFARFGATYFDNVLENEIFIAFTPNFETTPDNRTNDSTQQGIEFFASLAFENGLSVDGSYTYIDAREDGLEEIRRAPHIASASLSWLSADERFGVFLSIRYNGDQIDTQFTPLGSERVTLPAFTLVNLGGDFRLNENLEFFGRVENLFDESYEEVFSFQSAGRGFYTGIRGRI